MTISKRKDKYYCRFQINGERHHYLCKGATTIKEAEQMEMAFKYKLMQQQNGVLPKEETKKTFNSLFDYYLEYAQNKKKSYSQDKCRVEVMRKYFKPYKYISDIKPTHIEAFKTHLLVKGLSKTTVNRYIEILSKMFNMAIDAEWLDRNPIKRGVKFAEKNYTVRYLTEEEEERLFKALPTFLLRIVFADLMTGFRKGNILNLTWEQINLEFRYIELLDNKGNKHIRKPINSKLFAFLMETPVEERHGYVFINPLTGDRCRDIRRPWKKALKEAGISNFRFHDLRHTVATRMVKQGIPLPVVKEVLDHSDIKTTMRYNHVADKQLVEAMEALGSCA